MSLYLVHYGITGMKWGVRRYQNPDGSYTDAGRKRYGLTERQQKKNYEAISKASSNSRKLDEDEQFEIQQEALNKNLKIDPNDIKTLLKARNDAFNNETERKIYEIEEKSEERAYQITKELYDKEIKRLSRLGTKLDERAQDELFEQYLYEEGYPKAYSEYPEYEKLQEQSDKNWKQYCKVSSDIGKKYAGNYYREPIDSFRGYSTTYGEYISDYIEDMISKGIDLDLLEKLK